MDISLERDGNAIGSLFQQIINDMKNSSPLWEDFMAKASKLHACLRATIQAIAAYLDAFQKIADAATNSRGATKEIGTALTRVCLRHKAVETRMKSFTTAIMDCLIIPLQDKLEDWKRQAAVLDKDHAKEYKRCRTELKKRSSDTLRLQKKARKGQTDTIQSLVETSMHDINQKRAELEDVERKSLRAAMVEERTRYCTFVNLLQPVVKEECEVMYELGHLQEAMDSIAIVTKDPTVLPQSSEELILESKTSMSLYPESPGGSHGCNHSLGSRKSSVCSISSMNSSGSSGSPGHQYQRSLSQLISPALRLKPGESSDSGFCSSSALTSQTSTTSTNPTHAVSTWPPHSQDAAAAADRPHTISTAYEKGHQRPALTVYTFQNPEVNSETQKSPANVLCRPPLPIRCSSLERPLSSTGARNTNVQTPRQCPSPLPAHITKEHPILQPTYVNMSELASMAASKITNNSANQQQTLPLQQQYQQQTSTHQQQQIHSPVLSIASSLVSSDSSATNHQSSPDVSTDTATPQNYSPQTNESLPQTPTVVGSQIGGSGDDYSDSVTTNDHTNSETSSADNDFKSIGSVLEKLSLFERLEQKQILNNNVAPSSIRVEGIFNRKNEEIYKAVGLADKDADQIYEDSIQELNNLIGELDSFQKEHELKSHNHSQTPNHTVDKDFDAFDKISVASSNIGSIGYSIQSNNSNDSKFTFNETDPAKYYNENSSGFESNASEIIHCDNNFNETESYLKDNSEIVVLRRKGSTTDLNGMADGNLLTEPPQRLSSFKSDGSRDELKLSQSNLRLDGGGGGGSISNIAICDTDNEYKVSGDERIRAKPTVTPRPASLSGCVSRITRRSSVNSTKPPPPVRRSSSVTPSPHGGLNNSPNISQQNSMNASSESLPPPPSYLLDSSGRTSPGKVCETVKALTELRHMPASPGVIRRAQALALAQTQMTNQSPTPPQQYSQNSYSTQKSDHTIPNSNFHYTSPPPPQQTSSTHTSKPSEIYQNSSHRSANASQSGIYAQPKVSKVSSFRNPSPVGSTKQQQNSNLMAQLNARITPNNKSVEHQSPTADKKIYAQNQSNQGYHTYDTRSNVQPIKPQRANHHNQQVQQQQQQQQIIQQHQQQQQQIIQQHQQQQQQIIQQQQQHYNTGAEPIYQQSQSIYTRASDRNYHYQQQQLIQQQQQQQQHHYNQSIDGKNQIYASQIQPHHQQQQQQQQQQPSPHHHRQPHHIHQKIYVSTNPFITTTQTTSHYQPTSQLPSFGKESSGQYSTTSNYSTSYEKSNNTRSKVKVGFLENLNAKLAEQRLSGKAFAVRNLINSKALPRSDNKSHIPVPSEPDPRICHESLMDQIKRGATLKRNKSINDRSAPKIH